MERSHFIDCIVHTIVHTTLLTLFVSLESSCRDVKPVVERYLPDYTVYHNLTRVQSHLLEIASKHPKFVHIDWAYRSLESRPQPLIRITNFTDSSVTHVTHQLPIPKVKILLSFGEHAREFLPIESMFHILINLTTGLSASQGSNAEIFSRTILSKVDLFIVAMANPDGRHHVEETGNYCWRGTSNGVDLNRNFNWHFGQKGSSGNKFDEEYRGSHPFSEPECLVLTDLTSKYQFDAFVSLHSGIRQIYVPYADTISKKHHKKPENLATMLELADQMAHSSPNEFTYGMAYQLNEYTADGTIFDYMAGIRKIPFSFAIELWGEGDHDGAKCFDLFNPRSQDLQKSVEDIHPIFVTLFNYMIHWKEKQATLLHDPLEGAPSLTFGFSLLILIVILTVFMAIQNRLPPCLRIYPRRRIVSLRSLSSTFTVMSLLKT